MNVRFPIAFLSLAVSVASFAQGTASKVMTFPRLAVADASTMTEDYAPSLQCIEAPKPGTGIPYDQLKAIKDSLKKVYGGNANKNGNAQQHSSAALFPPSMKKNFNGNTYGFSVPNDNDIAVSNGGKIISVINTTVMRYDENTNTNLGTVSLMTFFSALSNSQTKFDPKVMYDPQADRFILIALAGFTSTTSSIVVGFSQTNDPMGAWNLYSLPGNPFSNTTWTDFPMCSITNQELFITVNLLKDGMSWQAGFVESLIWQVKKQTGYSGSTLLTKMHSNIFFGGKPIRNLCPAEAGKALAGPGMYFISNRNFSAQNDSIFLVYLNDTINSSSQTVTVNLLKANNPYYVPPLAKQKNTPDELETNDARPLGAILENNTLQFVGNTMDPSSSRSAIYHGVISNVNTSPVISTTIVGDPGMDFGYPNISYVGLSSSDNSAIISFDHSGPNDFPGVSAITTDGAGNYSARTTVKLGTNYVNVLSGDERWGDYSGSQPRYNQPGVVWVSGLYSNNSTNNLTWIAELENSLVGTEDFSFQEKGVNLYPNPVVQTVLVEFNNPEAAVMSFDVFNVEGKHVKTLLNDRVKAGVNRFYFSAEPLLPGVYFLKVSNPADGSFVTKRFVKI